jgi:hypothetical protein
MLTFGDLFDDGCLYNQEFALAYFDYLNSMIEGFVEAVSEMWIYPYSAMLLRIVPKLGMKGAQATHE